VRQRWLARLGFARRGGGCGVDGTKGAGRRLYRAAKGPQCAGPGRRAGGRAAAGLGRESEPGSSLRTGPTGRSCLAVREEGKERGGVGWAVGPGKGGEAGWAAR
jgi:hypothetical protein